MYRIDPTLLNPLGSAATPAMIGSSSLPFQNTSMQAAQFLAAQTNLNSLPIPAAWTLPLARPNIDPEILRGQSQLPPRYRNTNLISASKR